MEKVVRIDRQHPMKLPLVFHEDGPKVASGQCKIEDTFRNLRQLHESGKEIPELILEVNDIRIVGPLMKLFKNYPVMTRVASIKTHTAAVSCNVKTINLETRLHVEVIRDKG